MGATLFVQPLDLIKNRMQLSGEGGGAKEHKTSLHAFRSILKNEGVSGLYSGLSAGLLRQASYTTVRMGVYTTLFEMASGKSLIHELGAHNNAEGTSQRYLTEYLRPQKTRRRTFSRKLPSVCAPEPSAHLLELRQRFH